MYIELKIRYYFAFCIFFLLVFVNSFFITHAKSGDYATVASPVVVVGDVNDHDIISYDSDNDMYIASEFFSDESVLGVVVDDPVLYMESNDKFEDGIRPVVRFGEALVNVSTFGGEINAGDIITTSEIPGIGQKVMREDTPYILGFALESMKVINDNILYDGEQLQFGTVLVALRIGPYITKEGAMFLETGRDDFESYVDNIYKEGGISSSDAVGAFKVFRYLLAVVVAVTAIAISVTRFGDTFKEGVVSIGRNPLARSQIHSMLFWNIILIILVTGAGLGIATAIILLP